MISLDCLLEKWQFENNNNNNMSEQSFQKETYSLLYHPQSSYIPYAYRSIKKPNKTFTFNFHSTNTTTKSIRTRNKSTMKQKWAQSASLWPLHRSPLSLHRVSTTPVGTPWPTQSSRATPHTPSTPKQGTSR